MPMPASEIERLIKASIPEAEVTIRDLAGDGDHYAARVVAGSFEGMSRVRQHQAVYSALVSGTLDRAKFTDNLNYYFDATTLGDYRSSLAPLGAVTVEPLGPPRLRGGFVNRNFRLHYADGRDLTLITYAEPGDDGRWEQFIIMPH